MPVANQLYLNGEWEFWNEKCKVSFRNASDDTVTVILISSSRLLKCGLLLKLGNCFNVCYILEILSPLMSTTNFFFFFSIVFFNYCHGYCNFLFLHANLHFKFWTQNVSYRETNSKTCAKINNLKDCMCNVLLKKCNMCNRNKFPYEVHIDNTCI